MTESRAVASARSVIVAETLEGMRTRFIAKFRSVIFDDHVCTALVPTRS